MTRSAVNPPGQLLVIGGGYTGQRFGLAAQARFGIPVRLTSRERELLRTLAANAGAPVARVELAPEASEEGARSVDVQINRLRQKIEDDPSNPVHLQTVRGAGYVLHAD